MTEEDYNNCFLVAQCEKDTHPNYMRRNEECYTAPWVNLNSALSKVIENKYIDIDALKKSNDYELVEKAIDKTNDFNITLPEFENIITSYSNFTLEEIFTSPYGIAKVPSNSNFNITNPSLTYELDG